MIIINIIYNLGAIMNQIISPYNQIPRDNQLPRATNDLDVTTQGLLNDALSEATKKAYATDWCIFQDFCLEYQYNALPASQETIIAFLTNQATENKALQTIRRRLAAIKFVHNIKGFALNITDKMITLMLKGIARQKKGVISKQKKPISADLLMQMLGQCDTEALIGKRDKALLLFGFAGAFRRSELCNLTLDDLEETQDGLKVHLRSSKGDQFGEGQVIALPHGRKMGVITALKEYLEMSNIHNGFIFRSVSKGGHSMGTHLTPLSVALIVKKYIKAVGYNPSDYAAHSMRSGFLTEAAENGASLFKMLEVSRHKSADTLLGYIRTSNLFKDHAGDQFL
ncbi:MAG: site-specific recombinase XerD [Alphaproteobacteria bacterium]